MAMKKERYVPTSELKIDSDEYKKRREEFGDIIAGSIFKRKKWIKK